MVYSVKLHLPKYPPECVREYTSRDLEPPVPIEAPLGYMLTSDKTINGKQFFPQAAVAWSGFVRSGSWLARGACEQTRPVTFEKTRSGA